MGAVCWLGIGLRSEESQDALLTRRNESRTLDHYLVVERWVGCVSRGCENLIEFELTVTLLRQQVDDHLCSYLGRK